MTFIRSFCAGIIALSANFSEAFAAPEFSDLKEFSGWYAVTLPSGLTSIQRDDRPGSKIVLLPKDERPVTSQQEALERLEDMKIGAAEKYPQCAPIRDKELQNNGMGFDVYDKDENPACHVFIGVTKQGVMFTNVRIDDGRLDRQSHPQQMTAGLFLSLAVARLQNQPFLKEDADEMDLEQIIEAVPSESIPVKMIAAKTKLSTEDIALAVVAPKKYNPAPVASYRAIPLFENGLANACADWDPAYFTPDTLNKIDLKSAWRADAAIYEKKQFACRNFAWRQNAAGGAIEANNGGGWRSLGAVLNHEDLGAVEAFAKGEKLSFQSGSATRLQKAVSGAADLKSLFRKDILFRPDGRFWAGDLDIPTHAFGIYGVTGRYYVDGHIMVLDIDGGPNIVTFAGKTIENGKIMRLYISGSSYGPE